MKQKHISFSMKIGLLISAAAIFMSASSPFSNRFRAAGNDVIPFQPTSPDFWSDPIVATQVGGAGTNMSDATLEVGSSVFIDVAIANNNSDVITETFDACLFFDGASVHCWTINGLTANEEMILQEDYEMTYAAVPAQEGSHILELRVDEAGAIPGEVTSNNNFSFNLTWVESTPSTAAGALMADSFAVNPVDMPADVDVTNSNAPDLSDTSTYMIGKVAVSVILPESDGAGSTENWTQTEIDQVKAEVTAGLNNWETWYNTASVGSGDPALDFVIEWHTAEDLVSVTIPDDPTDVTIFTGVPADEETWVNQSLDDLLVPADANHIRRVYAYNNIIRAEKRAEWADTSADWAFTVFVLDSSSDTDGRLAPASIGNFAYSYLNGPFLVMTYDNADWGISQMNEVLAHQVAHIFGAEDKYDLAGDPFSAPYDCDGAKTPSTYGYLAIANSNCGAAIPPESLMFTGKGTPDTVTQNQIGWRDTDIPVDHIFDPTDTGPVIDGFINETPSQIATNHLFRGTAYDEAWTHLTRPITIRKLTAIEWRIDNGAWQNADISDGLLNSDREDFSFALPSNLGGGVHYVDVRATSNSTDPVKKYSVLGVEDLVEGTGALYTSRIKVQFSNDYFASATIISSLPYITNPSISTVPYTGGGNFPDPQDVDLLKCNNDPNLNRSAGDHSAWYRYTPTVTESVTINTLGSTFDTMLGVYLQEGNGDIAQIACDDDSLPDLKSQVIVALTSGRTYYISSSSFNGALFGGAVNVSSAKSDVGAQAGGNDIGGDLILNVTSNGPIISVPTVLSSVRADANPTILGSVRFTVTFSESVTDVDELDFNLTTTGVSGAYVSGISGTGNVYTVTVNTGNGNGTVRLNVNNGGIFSASNSPLDPSFTSGETYTVDKNSPLVISSLRAGVNPTTAASVNFTVNFSEAMTGVDISDFALTTTGITGASISGFSGSGSTYTVSVTTGSGNGTIRLDVLNNGSVINGSSHALAAGYTTGQKYRFFNPIPPPTNPLVNSILPTSRSIPVGSLATIYNAVINGGPNTAYAVSLVMNPQPAGEFSYIQTNCATNAIIGEVNDPVDVPAGGVVCYVLKFIPSAPFAATNAHIKAQAINSNATNVLVGINTWLLRSGVTPGPDTIALTTTTDFHQFACSGPNAFAVALSNVGVAATGDITATANTGATILPLSILIMETDPATGAIAGDHILQNVGAADNRTVAVFVTFNGCVAFDPAANRIFVEFRDAAGNVVGSTSTAVSTGR